MGAHARVVRQVSYEFMAFSGQATQFRIGAAVAAALLFGILLERTSRIAAHRGHRQGQREMGEDAQKTRPGQTVQRAPARAAELLRKLKAVDLTDGRASDLFDRVRREVYDIIGIEGAAATELVCHILEAPDVPDLERRITLMALGSHGTPHWARVLAQSLSAARLHRSARSEAICCLGRILTALHPTERVPDVMAAAVAAHEQCMTSADEQERAAATIVYLALRRPPSEAAAHELFAIFLSDPSCAVKEAATIVLSGGIAEGNAAIAALAFRELDAQNPELRRAAAMRILAGTRTPLATEAVLAGLHDPSDVVLTTAVWAAASLHLERAGPILARLLSAETPRAADAVIRALGTIGTRECATDIASFAASSTSSELRRVAWAVLAAMPAARDESLGRELVDLADQAPPDHRESVRVLLRRNPSALAGAWLANDLGRTAEEEREERTRELLDSMHGPQFAMNNFHMLADGKLLGTALQALAKVDCKRAIKEIADRYSDCARDPDVRIAMVETLERIATTEAVTVLQSFELAEKNPWVSRAIDQALLRIRDRFP